MVLVTINSKQQQKVWWKCGNGYEWKVKTYDRNKGAGCPYCYQPQTISVINIGTGKAFNSIKDAAKKYGIRVTDISGCCEGKKHRRISLEILC